MTDLDLSWLHDASRNGGGGGGGNDTSDHSPQQLQQNRQQQQQQQEQQNYPMMMGDDDLEAIIMGITTDEDDHTSPSPFNSGASAYLGWGRTVASTVATSASWYDSETGHQLIGLTPSMNILAKTRDAYAAAVPGRVEMMTRDTDDVWDNQDPDVDDDDGYVCTYLADDSEAIAEARLCHFAGPWPYGIEKAGSGAPVSTNNPIARLRAELQAQAVKPTDRPRPQSTSSGAPSPSAGPAATVAATAGTGNAMLFAHDSAFATARSAVDEDVDTLAEVRFHCHSDQFLIDASLASSVSVGSIVIVEGDRGVDAGEVRSLKRAAALSAEQRIKAARVLRVADAEELRMFYYVQAASNEALARVCRHVQEHAMTPGFEQFATMQVLACEFQFDMKTLTVFYTSRARLLHNSIVPILYREFQCRVWMVATREVGGLIGEMTRQQQQQQTSTPQQQPAASPARADSAPWAPQAGRTSSSSFVVSASAASYSPQPAMASANHYYSGRMRK